MRSAQTADLRRALLESRDTVTQILERRTGEQIVADVVRHDPTVAETDNVLGVPTGHPLVDRLAVLRGGTSARAYVYAASLFVPDRLPERAQQELAGTSAPIGRILLDHGFDLARRALPEPGALGPPEFSPTAPVDDGADEVIWARAYLLLLDAIPVFAIREWFYGSVLDPLDRPGPDRPPAPRRRER
jgi:chorismate-pyruvate lyase